MRVVALVAGAALAAGMIAPSIAADQSLAYHVSKTVALGPGERWDYVTYDPAAKRVYVAHGDHVTVVDETKGEVVGQIGGFPGGTHGIAISTLTGQGYTDDGHAGVAVPFDLVTLKLGKPIATAPHADGIIYEPVTGHVYVVNGDSGSLTAIDPATNAAVATIDVGADLEAGVADGAGTLYVDGAAAHDIVRIDARTNRVTAHWPMPACQRPHGIAVDPATHRVFATCANKLMVVVSTDDGANIATVPIGAGSDGAAFDPVRKLAFSSNGEGSLSIVQERDAGTFVPLKPIETLRSARTMAIDTATGRLFLVGADVDKVEPPATPGGRPHVIYVPNSLKLFYLDPSG